jgi:7-keto-8-aminopelargonate synthetase-like enzyme
LKYTAPGFVFATGISPSNTAAALAAIHLLEQDRSRLETLRQRSELFLRLAKERGLNTGHSHGTPIVPVILGSSVLSLQMSAAMGRRGANVQPILYPAVEERAARLRFFITSLHTEDQIRFTVDAVVEELHALQSGEGEPRSDGGGAVFEAAARR